MTNLIIGSYKIIEESKKVGGFGEVYKACNQANEIRAVKMLRRECRADSRLEDMFFREAGIMKMLEHPNIVKVYDVGKNPEIGPYFFMEWMDKSLEDVIEKKKELKPDFSIKVIKQILQALYYAHNFKQGDIKGIVHGDIWPANIMFNDGVAKLTDFGLARKMAIETGTLYKGRQSGELFNPRATDKFVESIQGAMMFAAPEIVIGEKVDCRADIFSVGTLFYYILMGDLPHMFSLQPSEVIGSEYKYIDDVIKNSISPKKEERYKSAKVMLNHLDIKTLEEYKDSIKKDIEKHSSSEIIKISDIERIYRSKDELERKIRDMELEGIADYILEDVSRVIDNRKEADWSYITKEVEKYEKLVNERTLNPTEKPVEQKREVDKILSELKSFKEIIKVWKSLTT